MNARSTADEVLAFWFGEPPSATPRPEWFRKDAAFDTQIRQRFGATIDAALDAELDAALDANLDAMRTGGLADWGITPAGVLARIVVLDQFTRNTGRDTPRAFAGDALALADAQALVAAGDDRRLPPLQRWFAYLPFEHAEDAESQQQSLALFGALAEDHPALAEAAHWASKHAEVVARFGRYPHRNVVLGRVSTAQELAFLAQPGSSF